MGYDERVGFRLFTCNNLEDLAAAYLESWNEDCLRYRRSNGVFDKENIAVATRGMAIWLEQYLVQHGRVVAGMDFPFLRSAIDRILDRYAEKKGVKNQQLTIQFSEEVLVWRIYRLLKDTVFADLRQYLDRPGVSVEDGQVRRYELAVKLANLFYMYMAFIPEVLHPEALPEEVRKANRDAEYSQDKNWQLTIWTKLCEECDGDSPAKLMLEFLQESKENLADLGYEPMTFFGISAMPAYFLRVLKKLSTVTTVNFFYLNYCDEFWGDVKSDWELRQDKRKGIEDALEDHFNNPLLGNFGIQGREFFNALLDLTEEGVEEQYVETDYEKSVPGDTVLSQLQYEIRHNEKKTAFELGKLSADDDSVTFHGCYHMIREVEVLHDCLLKLIEKSHQDNNPLKMNDIIIMAPNIGDYAAAIRSVFDQGVLRGKYAISDRSVKDANLLASTFMAIIDLGISNFEYSRIMSLMGAAGLRNRFGISETDANRLRQWLVEAKVRHGDVEGMPEGYTWRQGLDRFLMKLALDAPAGGTADDIGLGGILPADIDTSGESLALISKLCALMDELHAFVSVIRTEEKSGEDWCDWLLKQVPVFFLADSDCAADYGNLTRTLRTLGESMKTSGLPAEADKHLPFGEADKHLPFGVVKSALKGALMHPASGEPFLNGKITFCSLLPMRGIPRRVIGILGMDAGEFPRMETKIGFNLLTRPQGNAKDVGDYNLMKYYDRSSVVEDNFTFLEAIMSAQEHLMLFYSGKNPQNLEDYPRAVPVDILYESVEKLLGKEEAEAKVTQHCMNNYDVEAFSTAEANKQTILGKFSFSKAGFAVAKQFASDDRKVSAGLRQDLKLTLPDPLPFNVTEQRQEGETTVYEVDVSLEDLERFMKKPTGRFLTKTLKFSYRNDFPEEVSDYESYETSALVKSRLRKEIFEVQRTLGKEGKVPLLKYTDCPKEIAGLRQRLGAENRLPVGAAGDEEFMALQRISWAANQEYLKQYNEQEMTPAKDFSLDLELREWDDVPKSVLTLVDLPFVQGKVAFKVHLHGSFRYWHGGTGAEESSEADDKKKAVMAPGLRGYEQRSMADDFGHPWGYCLKHLMLCAHLAGDVESVIFGESAEGKESKYDPVHLRKMTPVEDGMSGEEQAQNLLKRFVLVYLWGHLRPLPLFEKSSWSRHNMEKCWPAERTSSDDVNLVWKSVNAEAMKQLDDAVEALGRYLAGDDVDGRWKSKEENENETTKTVKKGKGKKSEGEKTHDK